MSKVRVPVDFADKRVCILGLGFVGITLATVMAEVGFDVIGVEIRDELVTKLNSGNPDFFEPGLSNQLKKIISSKQLQVYKNIPDEPKATVYIITVGTPIDDNAKVILNSIKNICGDIAPHLKDGDLVILRSTVKLGTTRNIALPLLEKTGKNFEIAFCPERTLEGQALTELRTLPQVIGADKPSTILRASQIFQFLTPTTIRVRDFETAEMIKLIDNTKRDILFAFSNEVAQMCNAAGLDVDEIIRNGRFGYSRTNLPIPGPVGGPCLSKDTHILVESMKDLYGFVPEMSQTARRINEAQPQEVVSFLKGYIDEIDNFPANPIISLLGIAFKGKPETDDLRGTTAKPIFEALKKAFPNATFFGYDPVVSENAIEEFGLIPKTSLESAMMGANLTLILNNHPSFPKMDIEKLSEGMSTPGIIYDFWNCFGGDNMSLPNDIYYIALGRHKRPVIGEKIKEEALV